METAMETKKRKEQRDRSQSPKKPTLAPAVDPPPELTPPPEARIVTPPLLAAPHRSAPASLPSSSTKKTEPLPDSAFIAPTTTTSTPVSPSPCSPSSSTPQEPRSCGDVDYSILPDAAKLLHTAKHFPPLKDINTYTAAKMLVDEVIKRGGNMDGMTNWLRELFTGTCEEEGKSSSGAKAEEVIKRGKDPATDSGKEEMIKRGEDLSTNICEEEGKSSSGANAQEMIKRGEDLSTDIFKEEGKSSSGADAEEMIKRGGVDFSTYSRKEEGKSSSGAGTGGGSHDDDGNGGEETLGFEKP